MQTIEVSRSKLSGDITPPPSKSHSIRAILFASLASKQSSIKGVLKSPDIDAMIDACKAIGADIRQVNNDLQIDGCAGKLKTTKKEIYVANSGLVLRFMTALLALQEHSVVVSGDESANMRPMQPLIDAIKQLGGQCVANNNNNGVAPIRVNGPLDQTSVTLTGEDSQFVSALLIALPFAEHSTEIQVTNAGEKPWIDLTCFWLNKLNINYQRNGYNSFKIAGNTILDGFCYQVPSDFSSLAYPLIAALITNSKLSIKNVDLNDVQGDREIIYICKKMGAIIESVSHTLEVLPSDMHGITIDLNNCIDAVPIMAVLGCYAKGTTTLTNIKIARTKECDRLAVMTKELKKMGANIQEFEDSLIIKNSQLTGSNVDSHHDHRVAMALTIAGMMTENHMVHNTKCIQKTYPNFVKDMQSIGARMKQI